jgi:hypothetical protein
MASLAGAIRFSHPHHATIPGFPILFFRAGSSNFLLTNYVHTYMESNLRLCGIDIVK